MPKKLGTSNCALTISSLLTLPETYLALLFLRHQGEFVACLLALLRQMSDRHYQKLLQAFSSKDSLRVSGFITEETEYEENVPKEKEKKE